MKDSYDRLKRLYTDVFRGATDYIPLIVSPPCPDIPSVDEFWIDNVSAVRKFIRALEPKIEAASDYLPTVEIGTYQGIVIPSLFGAEITKVDGSDPMARRCFTCLEEAIDADIPRVEGAVVEKMMEDLHDALNLLPDGYFLAFAPTASPFDLAQLMLGEDFMLSLATHPNNAKLFLQNLAEVSIRIIRMVKSEMHQEDREYITNRGIFLPGYRLPCDAIVNYSPEIIRQVVNPLLSMFGRVFGPLCIHFCTQPAPSRHVLPVLLDAESVLAVDNWQGAEDFLGDQTQAPMQSQITVIGDMELDSEEKMDTFLSRASVRDVPRRRGRGIVLSTSVKSVVEGKYVYSQWHNRMESLAN